MRNEFLEHCLKEKYPRHIVIYVNNDDTLKDAETHIKNSAETEMFYIFIIDPEIKNPYDTFGKDKFVIVIYNIETKKYRFNFVEEKDISEKNILKIVNSSDKTECQICYEPQKNIVHCPICSFIGCEECMNKYVKNSYMSPEEYFGRKVVIKCPICRSKIADLTF